MIDARWKRMRTLYMEALDRPNDSRLTFLERACNGDGALLDEVRALLHAEEQAGDFLDRPSIPVGLPERWGEQISHPPARELGDFVLGEELGSGGMGVVYRARQRSLDREVALKVLQRALTFSDRQVARFKLEATAAAKLQHKNIVGVHAVGEDAGCHWLAMELIHGPSLDAVLEELRSRREEGLEEWADLIGPGRSYPARIAALLAEVADALQYSHEHGVVHRDVKPGNVLLDADRHVRVADFGLAKDLDLESRYLTGELAGTPHYMSPEQARGKMREIDARSDVFSLGVVAYELLTLRRPFEVSNEVGSEVAGEGASPHEIFRAILEQEPEPLRRRNPSIPRDLETICSTALEKDPRRRYASAADMGRDLRHFLDNEAIEARPPGPAYRMRRWITRHYRKLAVGSALIAAFGLGKLWTERRSAERALDERLASLAAWPTRAQQEELDALELRAVRREIDELRTLPLSADERRILDAAERFLRDAASRDLAQGRALVEDALTSGAALGTNPVLVLTRGLERLERAGAGLPAEDAARKRLSVEDWYAKVSVSSSPSGALVVVRPLEADGISLGEPQELGFTPFRAVPVPLGPHRLVIASAGFGYAELEVNLKHWDDEYEFDVTLRPSAEVTADMVWIDAGKHKWGGVTNVPAQSTDLEGFWVDRYEVTNAEYKAFVDATGHRPPPIWRGTYDPSWDRLPVVSVSVRDAEAYALWTGKRLLTHEEWERMARGLHGAELPWGDLYVEGQAVLGPAPGTPIGDLERFWREEQRLYLERVRPVDSLPEGRSDAGMHHTLGNVREWTSTIAPMMADGNVVRLRGMRVVKGLSWKDGNNPPSLAPHTAVPDEATDAGTGFRCARGTPP